MRPRLRLRVHAAVSGHLVAAQRPVGFRLSERGAGIQYILHHRCGSVVPGPAPRLFAAAGHLRHGDRGAAGRAAGRRLLPVPAGYPPRRGDALPHAVRRLFLRRKADFAGAGPLHLRVPVEYAVHHSWHHRRLPLPLRGLQPVREPRDGRDGRHQHEQGPDRRLQVAAFRAGPELSRLADPLRPDAGHPLHLDPALPRPDRHRLFPAD